MSTTVPPSPSFLTFHPKPSLPTVQHNSIYPFITFFPLNYWVPPTTVPSSPSLLSTQNPHCMLFTTIHHFIWLLITWGGDVAQLVERRTGTLLRQVRFPGAAKDFCPRVNFPVQTLLRCPYSPWVQSHALTSVLMLKIPSTGSHTFIWTHRNVAHTVRNV